VQRRGPCDWPSRCRRVLVWLKCPGRSRSRVRRPSPRRRWCPEACQNTLIVQHRASIAVPAPARLATLLLPASPHGLRPGVAGLDRVWGSRSELPASDRSVASARFCGRCAGVVGSPAVSALAERQHVQPEARAHDVERRIVSKVSDNEVAAAAPMRRSAAPARCRAHIHQKGTA